MVPMVMHSLKARNTDHSKVDLTDEKQKGECSEYKKR